jgi:eukaryotic-like serine/threonine-protein kinase
MSQPYPASTSQTGVLPASTRLGQGRYLLLGTIGQGGFGAVYEAKDTRFGGRSVAIKEMSQRGLDAQELLEATTAFQQEAELLASLMHPNLPRIYDSFTELGRSFLVMDFIAGVTLEQYARQRGGILPLEEVCEIGKTLCDVLSYLHRRQPAVIFRDLKPANIMRSIDGHLYLIDFGIARFFKPGQNRDTVALGSPGYAAPEQYGKAQTDGRADIYSLGAVLHALLSGSDPAASPFTFDHLPGWDSDARQQEADALLIEMLAMRPDQRPAEAVDAQLRVWDATSGSPRFVSKPLPMALYCVAWSPDDTRILVAGDAGDIYAWESRTGEQVMGQYFPFKYEHTQGGGEVYALAWSPSGAYFSSAGCIHQVRVWAVDGQLVGRNDAYREHEGSAVRAISWSPDAKYIASAGGKWHDGYKYDTTVHVWHARGMGDVCVYKGHQKALRAVAWSPDGTRIASGGDDCTVQVWEAVSGKQLLVYCGHKQAVTALSWSPDGGQIVSAGLDKSVRVWDADGGGESCAFGHLFQVNSVAWSPDGTRIASASHDRTVAVWQAP